MSFLVREVKPLWIAGPAIILGLAGLLMLPMTLAETPSRLALDNPDYNADSYRVRDPDEIRTATSPGRGEDARYLYLAKGEAVRVPGPVIRGSDGFDLGGLFRVENPSFGTINDHPEYNAADGVTATANPSLRFDAFGDDFEHEVALARVEMYRFSDRIETQMIFVNTGDGVAHRLLLEAQADGRKAGTAGPYSIEARGGERAAGSAPPSIVTKVPGGWITVGVGAMALGTVGMAKALPEARRAVMRSVLLAPLFSRVQRNSALDHPLRSQLLQAIEEEPGIHFHELHRRLELPPGTIEFHLRRLVDLGIIAAQPGPRYTCYFPKGQVARGVMLAAHLLKAPHARSVLAYAIAHPGSHSQKIAEAVGITPQGLTYHAQRLEGGGLLKVETDGRHRRVYPTGAGIAAMQQLVQGGEGPPAPAPMPAA